MANTDPSVLKEKEVGGIYIYHNMGYKGKCNIMHLETPGTEHSSGVVADIYDIAPGVTVFQTGSSIISNVDGVKQANCVHDGVTWTIEDFIRTHGIKIVTESVGGPTVNEAMRKYWQGLIDKYNIILISSAGNNGTGIVEMFAPDAVCWAIGAVGITDSGSIKPKSYTSTGNEVDFAYFTGDQDGTSFACPRFVGVVALLLDRFGNRSKSEMFEMLKMLCKDVYLLGVDNKTGWGVPILHQDDNVRLGKMAEQKVTGTLREIDVKKLPDNVKKNVRAILYNNENYIRLRDFEDILGIADIEYDLKEKIPTVKD